MPESILTTDVEIVEWYECTRRPIATAETALSDPTYPCPFGPHWHYGARTTRNGAGRRISNARYHYARHLQAVAAIAAAGDMDPSHAAALLDNVTVHMPQETP